MENRDRSGENSPGHAPGELAIGIDIKLQILLSGELVRVTMVFGSGVPGDRFARRMVVTPVVEGVKLEENAVVNEEDVRIDTQLVFLSIKKVLE